jgi:predicted RNA-binding protein with RPS1 domain
MSDFSVEARIINILKETKKHLSLKEIQNHDIRATRIIMRKLERQGFITKKEKWLENSAKKGCKGTMIYTYSIA